MTIDELRNANTGDSTVYRRINGIHSCFTVGREYTIESTPLGAMVHDDNSIGRFLYDNDLYKHFGELLMPGPSPSSKSGRDFDTGAYRDTEEGKLDFEGFLSPVVLQAYAEYMNKNRLQSNNVLRDSDNWQKGIPIPVYMKSMWRHFFDVWCNHRGVPAKDKLKESLCALLFNVMGMLHEIIKEEK
jgi:hypothetical protein